MRQDRCRFTNASPTLASSYQDVPIRPTSGPPMLEHEETPLADENTETQAVERITKSMLQLSSPRLPFKELIATGSNSLLDPAIIDSDSPCKPRKGHRRARHHRSSSRPHGIPVPKLDYDLPAGFGERVRSRLSVHFTDFAIGGSPQL